MQRNKELSLAQHDLQKLNASLEATNKELESFSHSISHDLRSPLRAVDGFSNMLLQKFSSQLPAEAQRLLKEVSTSTKRMKQLIDDLLRFSHLGRQPLSKRLINVSALVHEVLEELRKYLKPETNVKIMVYNRWSWKVFWILFGYGKGQFWKLDRLIAEHSEAQTGCPVTYCYSRSSGRRWLETASASWANPSKASPGRHMPTGDY